MKKGLFGYNVIETDTILETLKEENRSLNKIITTLKTQIGKEGSSYCESDSGEKVSHKIESKSNQPPQSATDKEDTMGKTYRISSSDLETLNQANARMAAKIHSLQKENKDLNKKILQCQKQMEELERQKKLIDIRMRNMGEVSLDFGLGSLERAIYNTVIGLEALMNVLGEGRSYGIYSND